MNCSALYKYARELAIQYRNLTLFTSTDNKIKCGEPACPISAVTCRKK